MNECPHQNAPHMREYRTMGERRLMAVLCFAAVIVDLVKSWCWSKAGAGQKLVLVKSWCW